MGGEFIAETIQSILDQNYESLEIIIVDDCSTDDTREVVGRFEDHRISYHLNETNLGPKGNWNRCLALVNGKYYKLLPHDDLLLPNCVQNQVDVLERDINKEIAITFGARKIIKSDGSNLMSRYPLGKREIRLETRRLVNKCIRSGSNIVGEPGNGLIRADLITLVGDYDDEYPYLIDLDYWFRVLLHGDAHYSGHETSCFRISESAWSTKLGKKQHSDYLGFINKYSTDHRYEVTRMSKLLGSLNSYLASRFRRLVYIMLHIFSARKAGEKGH
jgi:glycosyltransferase involved in cell wall biosynthesis